MVAGSADLSFSAHFLRKIRTLLSTRHILGIAGCLLILLPKDYPKSSKNALRWRLLFAGAVIVAWNQGGCPPSWMLTGPSRGTLTDPTIMKKLLPSAILALVVSGVVTSQSFGWGCCFGLIPHHGCGCCGCGAQFCVRQYNAFSPVCCGTIYCDGCSPFGPPGGGYGGCGMGPGGCGLPYSGVLGGCCGPAGCADGACLGYGLAGGADGACLGSLPAADPSVGAPGAPTAPAAPLPTGPTSQLANDRPIQNATYRPASYTLPSTPSALVPNQWQPQMMAAPSYWGN
jgi:hypothetical protein